MGGAPVTSALGSTAKPEIALAMLMAPFKSAWRVYPHLWHRKRFVSRFHFKCDRNSQVPFLSPCNDYMISFFFIIIQL